MFDCGIESVTIVGPFHFVFFALIWIRVLPSSFVKSEIDSASDVLIAVR